MSSLLPCYSQDNGPYALYIDLKSGGDNQERIEYQRRPRSTARVRNRKRKASATRNGPQDGVQPARKRARTALQREHYSHDDPDNGGVYERLSGTLPLLTLARTMRITTWKARIYRRANHRFTPRGKRAKILPHPYAHRPAW